MPLLSSTAEEVGSGRRFFAIIALHRPFHPNMFQVLGAAVVGASACSSGRIFSMFDEGLWCKDRCCCIMPILRFDGLIIQSEDPARWFLSAPSSSSSPPPLRVLYTERTPGCGINCHLCGLTPSWLWGGGGCRWFSC